MITVRKIRNLPVSAASGLVIIGNTFYAVADDALHLGVYQLDDENVARKIRLRDGELPTDEKARKKKKPDFEALVRLPPMPQYPHGALLALGSGSKKNRQQAVLIPLDAHSHAMSANTLPPDKGGLRGVDLATLYESFELDDTNIEGAVACGETLVLLQRGNNKHEKSALVLIPLSCVSPCEERDPSVAARHLPYVAGEAVDSSPCEVGGVARSAEGVIIPCTLPYINGVPYGFTDGTLLPNGNILFSAVVEDSDDSYNDGACLGAAIGEVTLHGEIIRFEKLPEIHKIEGIALSEDGTRLYAVTDADDPEIPAELLVLEGW